MTRSFVAGLLVGLTIMLTVLNTWKPVIGHLFPRLADRIDAKLEKRFINKMIRGYDKGSKLLQRKLRSDLSGYVRRHMPKPLPRRDTWGSRLNTPDERVRVRRITEDIETRLGLR
jgi:hypothetical protein